MSSDPTTHADLWERVVTPSVAPEPRVVAIAAALVLVVVLEPHAWRVTRNVVTIVHEGAHMLVALLCGRRLKGVRVHSDTSGVAVSSGKPTGLGMVLTTFAGYVGPGLLGLGAAAVLGTGHAVIVLWIGVAAIAAMLLLVRNLYGFVALGVVGAGLFALVWFGTAQLQVAAAYFTTLFLLVAAPRPVLELQRARRRGRAPASDADQLAALTRIPGLFWVAAFLIVDVACLVIGARWTFDLVV